MRKEAFVLLAVFLMFGISAVHYNEYSSQNDDVEVIVNIANNLNEDFDDTRVKMVIPELGVVVASGQFDLYDNSKASKHIFWDARDIPAGDYLARITVSNDKFKSVKHRYITII